MSIEYANGKKNNWRSWIWNRVVERISCKTREAIVLYLGGPRDLDRTIALRHRFLAHNLICIEKELSIVKQLRRNGVSCIHGKLEDVLIDWPVKTQVAAILGDFCCGLHRNLGDKIMASMAHGPFLNSVYAINFLRGRDEDSNELRKLVNLHIFPSKHRGEILIYSFLLLAIQEMAKQAPGDFDANVFILKTLFEDETTGGGGLGSHCLRPCSNSYRSYCGQTFDSIVFTNPIGSLVSMGVYKPLTKEEFQQLFPHHPNVGRFISPIIAHRTMRLNGAATIS